MTTTQTTAEDYARRVRRLLDQAENTEYEAEAEAFREKAYALMEKYSIDQAMLNGHEQVERDELVTETFDFTGRFADANLLMSFYVATAFGMRGTKGERMKWQTGEKIKVLTLYGFASDMAKFRILNASLQIQAVRAQKEWERRIGLRTSNLAQWDKFKARRAFITGFGNGVHNKLEQARRMAEREVAKEQATATGVTEEEASTGVALVLRDRKETVDEWYDEIMGGGRRRKGRSFSNRGAHYATRAGREAGEKADTGQGGLGGNRRAIR